MTKNADDVNDNDSMRLQVMGVVVLTFTAEYMVIRSFFGNRIGKMILEQCHG